MKLTTVVNFINLIRANFTYESLFSSYVLALNELLYEKRARKMLMKLTPDVNLISNIYKQLNFAYKFVVYNF